MRLSVAMAAACVSIGLALADPVQAGIRKTTNIEAQRLAPALQRLAKERHIQVVYRSELVGDRHTGGAVGEYTVEEALTKLLSGTGLTFQFLEEEGITIVPVSAPERATSYSHSSSADAGAEEYFPDRLRVAQAEQGTPAEAATTARASQAGDKASASGIVLQEVVVTATKREERLQDVPFSIAVISTEDLERRGATGMEDYLRSIPGVNQIDRGARDNTIVIRGITTSPEAENFSSGTTVATYFDETPITAAGGAGGGGIDVRPVDIERIEVLRGPQGTAYGSSSLGGTLRIIPVKPKLDAFGAKVVASYSDTSGFGSDNSMVQGILNIPIVADKFGLRTVAYRYEDSGVYRNIAGIDPRTLALANRFGLGSYVSGYTKDDVGRTVSSGGRVAALWTPTDKLNLSLNFLSQKIEQDGAPQASIGTYEQTRLPIAPQSRVRGEAGETSDTEMNLVNLILNYDLGWAGLTSATSYIDSGTVLSIDNTPISQFPGSNHSESDFRSFTTEARLASQLEGRIQFLGGVYYEKLNDNVLQVHGWPGTPATNPVVTNPMFISWRERPLDQRAVFGETSYELTDTLTATVGGRYFKYSKNEIALREGGLLGVVGGVPLVPIGTGVPQHSSTSEDGKTLKANLSYKPSRDASWYASWAEGFRLGRPDAGVSAFICDTNHDGLVDNTNISIESTRIINSDFLESYELGGKLALLDRRLLVDAAVYHINWDGLPIRAVAGSCPSVYTANVGAATSDGVEFQTTFLVMEGLKLEIGGGYTKAKLSKDAPAVAGSPKKGARLPGSPEISVNLSAQYDFDVAGHKTFVRADSFYTGEFYGDLLQSPLTRAGDYIKVDARAGVTINSLSVELFVRNLTNEDEFTWRGLSNANASLGYRLRPRTVGVQLGYRFE